MNKPPRRDPMVRNVLILLAAIALVAIAFFVAYSLYTRANQVAYKPVIYLYPEQTQSVEVKLDYNGQLTHTYPRYDDGWTVTASPDGTLTDRDGQTYRYLFWEGEDRIPYDRSRGFSVRGEDSAAFLEDSLEQLGLTRDEANEFIVFWLPMLEKHPYNTIHFQTTAYTDAAKLEITPEPDTLIRVFMTFEPSDGPVEIEPQLLEAPERKGFTVVEWGGSPLEP